MVTVLVWYSDESGIQILDAQWGSEVQTGLDFEWPKQGWVAIDLDFKWDLKSGSPTI